MKIKNLTLKQKNDIIKLECQNIIPILASVGIESSQQDMIKEVELLENCDIILDEDENGINGFLVFLLQENFLLIKTFNIKKQNPARTIISLLRQSLDALRSLDVKMIKSHAHLTNLKSINFHLKMGFNEVNRNHYCIEYEIQNETIIKIITRRLALFSKP